MYIEEKVENILRQLDRISKTLLDLDKQVQDLRADMDRKQPREPYTPPYTPPPYNPWNPSNPWVAVQRCPVCNMSWEGPMGYVCNNPNCPSRVTCVSNTTTYVPDAPVYTLGTTYSMDLPAGANTTYYATYGDKFVANTKFEVSDGKITGFQK
jgi:hypothetical protein